MSFIEECTGACNWDELILQRFEEFVPENSTVIDIGANHGIFSFGINERMKLKEIYAIEADLENFNILKSKTSSESNIKLINVAISDNVGKVDIYEGNGDHATRNILGNDSINDNLTNKCIKRGSVNCATLDFIFIDKLNIQPNACKIDTEGAETLVLKGAKELIKKMDCLFVEIHNKTTYREIIEMCFENKWKVSCLKNLHQIKSIDELDYCYQVIIFPTKK
jgi:FkbM family methyltransferase